MFRITNAPEHIDVGQDPKSNKKTDDSIRNKHNALVASTAAAGVLGTGFAGYTYYDVQRLRKLKTPLKDIGSRLGALGEALREHEKTYSRSAENAFNVGKGIVDVVNIELDAHGIRPMGYRPCTGWATPGTCEANFIKDEIRRLSNRNDLSPRFNTVMSSLGVKDAEEAIRHAYKLGEKHGDYLRGKRLLNMDKRDTSALAQELKTKLRAKGPANLLRSLRKLLRHGIRR